MTSPTNSRHQLLPVASGRQVRDALRALMRPHGLLAATAATMLLAGNIAALVGPPILGSIVDRVVEGADEDALIAPVLILLLSTLGAAVGTALGTSLIAQLGEAMLARLRERVVERALHVPISLVERAGTGDLVSRVSGDVAVVSTSVREAFPAVLGAGLTIGLTVVGLGVLDWRFALAALCAAPIQALTLRWYLRASGPVYASERAAEGELSQTLYDSIDGASTVRAFRLQEPHLAAAAAGSEGVVRIALRAANLRTWFFGWLNLAEFVGMTAILVAGFLLVRADAVTVGMATAAALYFHRLFDPINTLLALFDDVQSSVPALARLVGVAEMPLSSERIEAAAPADASMALEGVSHAYDAGHEVLHGVDLRIAPREHISLVGASGAGKTTVAKLLIGAIEPTEGHVCVGDVPATAIAPEALRRTVAMVSQETHVFAGTLADDLRLARPEASDAALRESLTAVGALGWVEALPAGLDTPVGSGGHMPTSTQAQQIALARLLLADRPVVILDEATAEAGSAGARTLEAAATTVIEGRTSVVIAHRLSQAVEADRIVVMDAGRIVEAGTHDQLVASGGAYARLWTAWASARE